MSTDYVDRIYAKDPSARDDVRLFMLPGVLHCYDGEGPPTFVVPIAALVHR